jgi:uncharacterized RDD family membrane protein YckC
MRDATLVRVLDALWPLWDSKRQTLHDKLARTVVITGEGGADAVEKPSR